MGPSSVRDEDAMVITQRHGPRWPEQAQEHAAGSTSRAVNSRSSILKSAHAVAVPAAQLHINTMRRFFVAKPAE